MTLCFFGEGASTIGGFAEGLALAALWKLPVVLICENNQYSMGTPLYRSLAVEDVSMRALAHALRALVPLVGFAALGCAGSPAPPPTPEATAIAFAASGSKIARRSCKPSLPIWPAQPSSTFRRE